MLRTAARLSTHSAHLAQPRSIGSIVIDPQIWKLPEISQGIGLAVSGGVDSMALACLCRDQAPLDVRQKMWALVVDHQLREESREEALKTKDTLENRLGRLLTRRLDGLLTGQASEHNCYWRRTSIREFTSRPRDMRLQLG
jgi:tRNA(Ile)-lysidine synthase TilS/MesJ